MIKESREETRPFDSAVRACSKMERGCIAMTTSFYLGAPSRLVVDPEAAKKFRADTDAYTVTYRHQCTDE